MYHCYTLPEEDAREFFIFVASGPTSLNQDMVLLKILQSDMQLAYFFTEEESMFVGNNPASFN